MAAKKKAKKLAAKKSAPKKAAKKAAPAKKAPVKKAAPKASAPKAAKSPLAAKAVERTKALKTLSPLDDRIVVALDQAAEKTAGGLYIPGTSKGVSVRGTVVAVGPGHRNKKGKLRPLDVQVGDRVMFSEYAGTKITVGSGEALILREEEVLGVET